MGLHGNRWNPVLVGLLAGGLALGAYLSYYAVRFGLNHPPSATGDEPEYDSLGWELAHGGGFRVDYANEQFRRPYEQAAEESELYRLMTDERIGTIAGRPPLLPFVMSLTNRLFGRQYWGIRIVNATCMAAICGMLVTLVYRLALGGASDVGTRDAAPGDLVGAAERKSSSLVGFASLHTPCCLAATSAFLFVVVDTRTRLYGRAILTEALAAVEVAVLSLLLIRFAKRPTLRVAAGIGGLMAVALLTRTQFVLWLPGLLLVVFWLTVRRGGDRGTKSAGGWFRATPVSLMRAAATASAMLVVTLVLVSPWMVRNCRVLGEFMPLGSQGWTQLSAAFGDAVWDNRGVWPNLRSDGFYDDVLRPEASLLETEVAMAHFSRRRALDWIAAHPGRALALGLLKVFQEFRPRTMPEAVILTLSVIGAVLTWRDERTRILLAVVAVGCVAIAATWSVEGRFLVPLLYPQHALIGLGLVSLWRPKHRSP